jgi:hypothetical protein
VRDQVSHPYSTTGKITVLYILIFKGANPYRKPGKSRGPEVAAPSLNYSATDWYSAEELLILLINFMK